MVASSRRTAAAVSFVGRRALRSAVVRRAALMAAAARGHGLILVFHRITEQGSEPQGLVPSVPEPLFRRQLEALLEAGDIVPLESLLAADPGRRRPRFALTFDDDWSTHSERALPVLRSLGVTATFFLSGRSLHGLGPLWFDRLDAFMAVEGTRAAARWLGLDMDDTEQLATACETDLLLQQRIEELPAEGVRPLPPAGIRTLAEAGMTIGFHTLQHPLLTLLPEQALDNALVRGRSELEEATGAPIRLFAYPHGKADSRVARRLPGVGFVAACTGRPVPVRPGDDPYRLGRWEPGPIDLDRFAAGVAARLNGWSRGA